MSVADPNPLLRPEVYSFTTSSTTVEAAAKTKASGVWTRDLIVNSARDVVTGYKMRAVEPTLTIRKNLATSPLTLIDAIVNKTNEWPWSGGAGLTWLCTSISGEQKTETVGTEIITYWAVAASFAYRADNWNLRIKDIGLNERVERDGGGYLKRRCRVYDQNGNLVAATTAQPLNSDGTQRDSDAISELEYTIYEWADFSNYFDGPT